MNRTNGSNLSYNNHPVFNYLHDVVFQLNNKNQITYINNAVLRYGYDPNQIVGKNILYFVSTADKKKLIKSLSGQETKNPAESSLILHLFTYESNQNYNKAKSLKIKPCFRLTLYKEILNKVHQESAILGIANDITEQKLVEDALQLSEEKFSVIFENSQDAILVLKNQKIQYCNHNALDLFKKKEEELLNKTLIDFSPKIQADGEPSLDKLRKKLHNAVNIAPQTFEWSLLKSNDQKGFIELTLKSVNWYDGSDILVIAKDITKRKHLEEELLQIQKMESIGSLAGGIAHDMNNILMAILGYTEIANYSIDKGNLIELRSCLDQVYTASIRAKELVYQILTISSKSKIQKQPIKLQTVLNEALNFLRSTVPCSIIIEREFCQNDVVICANMVQIYQIIMNLCINSVHAMDENKGIIKVKLENIYLEQGPHAKLIDLNPGEYALLSIKDNGHGIEKNVIDKIFEPFFTTKNKEKGTGLGLSVVYNIVRDYKGTIQVKSEKDKGCEFFIYLPKYDSKKVNEIKKSSLNPVSVRGKGRILFVDDEKAIVDLGKLVLENRGYFVRSFTDVNEVLCEFKNNPDFYDLAILDLVMPKISGLQLTEELRHIRPELKVIIITGNTNSFLLEKAKELQIKIIQKPFSIEEMHTMIQKYISQ